MPRCTYPDKHQGWCAYDQDLEKQWLLLDDDGRCDFHIVVMPYNDFLDKFESRDE